MVGIYDQRAIGLALKKDWDGALNAYSAAIRLDQKNSSLKARRAHVLVLKGEFRTAIAELTAIIKAEPNNVEALLLRGSGLEAIGKSDEAATDYAAILKFEPTQAEARAAYERLKIVPEPTPVTTSDESLITRLQRELERVGCDPGEIDGLWGDETRDALRQFAKSTGKLIPTEQPTDDALREVSVSPKEVCTETLQSPGSATVDTKESAPRTAESIQRCLNACDAAGGSNSARNRMCNRRCGN